MPSFASFPAWGIVITFPEVAIFLIAVVALVVWRRRVRRQRRARQALDDAFRQAADATARVDAARLDADDPRHGT